MNFHDRRAYACYDTQFLSLAFRRSNGLLAFLGIDSGGRSDRKNTYNLLKPSFGARMAGLEDKPSNPVKSAASASGFRATDSRRSLHFKPESDRAFKLSFSAVKGEAALHGAVFEMSLMIKTAPPTIWADTKLRDPIKEEFDHRHWKLPKSRQRPGEQPWLLHADVRRLYDRTWQLPMLLHFPDYGTIRVECIEGDLECREELICSDEMSGLNLGHMNHSGHTVNASLHHGRSRLVFRALKDSRRVTLRVTVLQEIAPRPAKGRDFTNSPGWEGFHRCFLNNFPLERRALTMGDNISLSGLAHLCVHRKADMLALCDPGQHPLFARLHDLLERQVDAGLRCQAADGEIERFYFMRPKPKEALTTAFIDSTPSSIIAACMVMKRKPELAGKWLPALSRAARFLLSMDRDGDGLIEVPLGGLGANEPYENKGPWPRNWWDNISYGHKDAWFNLLCHRALRMLEKIARVHENRADAALADDISDFLAKFAKAFKPALVNPETGVVAGWRDVKGKLHDYYFTCPTAMATEEGLLAPREARPMLRKLLGVMRDSGFGDNRFGIPGNCVPIPFGGDTAGWAFMGEWPMYENGGCCGLTAWHFLNALYKAGLAKEADAIYFRMLGTFEHLPTHSGLFPGYMESVDWRTKDGLPCGYNYLADNYNFLAAGYLAHLARSRGLPFLSTEDL